MRVAALDIGKVRVALAVSDELGLIAHPRPPLNDGNQGLLAELAALARSEKIAVFWSGCLEPRGTGARPSADVSSRSALANATGEKTELVDERLSTVEANRRLRERRFGKEGEPRRSGIGGRAVPGPSLNILRPGQARRAQPR